MHEVGAKAAELLIQRLGDPNRPVSQIILGPHLILRGSEHFQDMNPPSSKIRATLFHRDPRKEPYRWNDKSENDGTGGH